MHRGFGLIGMRLQKIKRKSKGQGGVLNQRFFTTLLTCHSTTTHRPDDLTIDSECPGDGLSGTLGLGQIRNKKFISPRGVKVLARTYVK